MEIMPGFKLTDIETSGARIRLRHGGNGPPLLLLHSNPLTHVSWHAVAPAASNLLLLGEWQYPGHATDVFGYIGGQLEHHQDAAQEAFAEIADYLAKQNGGGMPEII